MLVQTPRWSSRWVYCAFSITVLWSTSPAFADEIADFQLAQNAYQATSYSLAVKRLEALVGGETPKLSNPALVLEARKYLGAAYLFVNRKALAEQQFERLLNQDPTYELDPVEFPTEVLDLFTTVRGRFQKQRDNVLAARKAAQANQAAEQVRKQEQMDRLLKLVRTERVVEPTSRWIAALPFGVGQFQNDHDGWGAFFAISEGTLVVVSIVSALIYNTIDIPVQRVGAPEPADRAAAIDAEKAWFITNVASVGLLGILAAVGIVDAQLRFKEERITARQRHLSPELTQSLRARLSHGTNPIALRF